MPYIIAISLLLLRQGVVAFQAPPNACDRTPTPVTGQRRQRYCAFRALPASLEEPAIPPLESILEDSQGHINGDLARAIYEWEVAHNVQTNDSVKEQFSTRDGLRLVDELAREILSSLCDDGDGEGDDNVVDSRKSGNSYNDLVQEGMIALLRAMSTYESYKSHTAAGSVSTFKEYARHSIRSSLSHFLAHSSRPIRLPLSLQTSLAAADAAAEGLRRALGREPTLVQVAKKVGIAPEQLALYRKLHRSIVSRAGAFVSVEDGMEVYDPTLAGVGVGTVLRPRRDMDSNGDKRAISTAMGKRPSLASLSASPLSTTNERDLTQLNSQEDDWTGESPERVVAPLRDVLADVEEINNPLSYTHHHLLNEELEEFLRETLTLKELQVIQLRFGLVDSKHGGKGWTAGEIGRRMGMGHDDVVRVASGALEKLRKAASTNWDEDNDAYVEVSL